MATLVSQESLHTRLFGLQTRHFGKFCRISPPSRMGTGNFVERKILASAGRETGEARPPGRSIFQEDGPPGQHGFPRFPHPSPQESCFLRGRTLPLRRRTGKTSQIHLGGVYPPRRGGDESPRTGHGAGCLRFPALRPPWFREAPRRRQGTALRAAGRDPGTLALPVYPTVFKMKHLRNYFVI